MSHTLPALPTLSLREVQTHLSDELYLAKAIDDISHYDVVIARFQQELESRWLHHTEENLMSDVHAEQESEIPWNDTESVQERAGIAFSPNKMFREFAATYQACAEQSLQNGNVAEYELLEAEAREIRNFFEKTEPDTLPTNSQMDDAFQEKAESAAEAKRDYIAQFNRIADYLNDYDNGVVGDSSQIQEAMDAVMSHLDREWQQRADPASHPSTAEETPINYMLGLINKLLCKCMGEVDLGGNLGDMLSAAIGEGDARNLNMASARMKLALCYLLKQRNLSAGTDRINLASQKFCLDSDSVIIGNHNQSARKLADKTITEPSGFHNPLIICGKGGMGKTVLLKSIEQDYMKQGLNVFYCSSVQFIDDVAAAPKEPIIKLFLETYKHVDVFLFDDLTPLKNKKKAQRKLSELIEYLVEHDKRVIIASDHLPIHVGLEEYLVKQLDGNTLTELEKPDVSTRIRLLNAMTKHSGHALSEDALDFIARHVDSNIRELEGALKSVVAQLELGESQDVRTALTQFEKQRQKRTNQQRKQERTQPRLLDVDPMPTTKPRQPSARTRGTGWGAGSRAPAVVT